ncbi:MAG: MBL fold metallo-hydrolase [Chloroflexota bacterium]|nr:MBL fold metallo-hydrolase [Chloroflexota bacterium]
MMASPKAPIAPGALQQRERIELEAPNAGQASIRFIGAATVLIQVAGFTILTDPAFIRKGEVARLGYGLRSMRLIDPALQPTDLPELDAVVLSHLHGDHFDRAAARGLPKTVPIVTTADGAATLQRNGFGEARGLHAWQSTTFSQQEARLTVTALPGSHAYGPLGALLPPVMGSLLDFEAPAGERLLRLYITGDTLVRDDLREIPARYPDIDIMLPHLGGTRLLNLFLATMDAAQGVELMRLIPSNTVIPIHYNDFTVYKSPLEDFRRAVIAAGMHERVRYLSHGQTHTFSVPVHPTRHP